MVKKAHLRSKKHLQKTDTHWLVRRSLLSYAVIVFLTFAMLSMSIFFINRLIVNKEHNNRYDKIMSIYNSLALGDSYRPVKSDVFGDKRVYSWDPGRTYSSSMEYAHSSTPTETAAELRKKVESAGFSYVQTEYEGSIQPIQEYKNKDGNWIRIGTMSKSVQDGFVYGENYGKTPFIDHKDEAPTYVTIKVNLDDNNE